MIVNNVKNPQFCPIIMKLGEDDCLIRYRKSSKETRGSYSFSEGANAGLIRILPNFCIFAYCFLSFLRVLLECGSYSRAGLFWGFTVYCILQVGFSIINFRSFIKVKWSGSIHGVVSSKHAISTWKQQQKLSC